MDVHGCGAGLSGQYLFAGGLAVLCGAFGGGTDTCGVFSAFLCEKEGLRSKIYAGGGKVWDFGFLR